jgi:hypothetical protein
MAKVAWIDFSSEHREKVRLVLDLLKQKGVLDELGIGVIRDSFADRLFPGINTIQTRAKYFLIIGHLLKEYLQLKPPKQKATPLDLYLKRREREVRVRLVEKHQEDSRNFGIIGSTFGTDPKRGVVRRPSSVYWNGLLQYGIVRPAISTAEFERRVLDRADFHSARAHGSAKERGDEADEADTGIPRVNVPEIEEDYWENIDIDLLRKEASFLRDQITSTQPRSLLAKILLSDQAIHEMNSLDPGDYEGFCELPFVSALDAPLRSAIFQARDFWRILRGAHILYDYLVQQRFGPVELQKKCEEEWKEWQDEMRDFPDNCKAEDLWERCRTSGRQVQPATRAFITRWIEEARLRGTNREVCEDLVRRQEMTNKGGRARLRKYADELRTDSLMGIRHLDFRLGQGQRTIRDIAEAERGTGSA